MEEVKQVKFQNQQNPKAAFDLIKLEELFQREIEDHDFETLHQVEFYILLVITGGKGMHSIDFTDYNCKKGTVLTIRQDQLHKFIKNETLQGYIVMFTNDFLVSYLETLERLKTLQLFNEQLGGAKVELNGTEYKELLELLERIKKEYLNTNDEYSLGIIRSELHILITKLYRVKASSYQTIVNKKYLSAFIEFQQLVEEHCIDIKKVKDYAQMLAISTKTLNNITQQTINKPAKAFINEIQTTQIKRLLINTNLSIKEVAYTSGFEETTNFYKFFKRETQKTPEQYRIEFK